MTAGSPMERSLGTCSPGKRAGETGQAGSAEKADFYLQAETAYTKGKKAHTDTSFSLLKYNNTLIRRTPTGIGTELGYLFFTERKVT